MPKPSVLVLTTSEGHRSIAEGVTSFLEKHDYTPHFCFIEEPGLRYYKFFYQHAPQLFKSIYEFSKTNLADTFLKFWLHSEHFHTLKSEIEINKPQVVINTSFGFTPSLLQLKKHYSFQFINILPNPRSFFRQDTAIGADALCIFDKHLEQLVKKYPGHPKTIQTGWFVRNEFEQEYNEAQVREMLGLEKELFTILFVAGSEGTETIFKLVDSLSHINTLQCIVACGNNKQLVDKVDRLAKSSKTKLFALPFTKEIYKYMQAADLVVGKAGPNMLFEAVACQTPFFATTHVAGLEDGNLEIIQEYNLGFVEEDQEKAIQLLKTIIQSPQIIDKKTTSVKTLADYLKTQKHELLKYLSSLDFP